MRVAVLGCGLVGGPMVHDLAEDPSFSIKVADRSAEALEAVTRQARVETVQADLSDPARIRDIVADCDLVLSAVPGSLGYRTLEAVIQAGKDVVDIAFFPEDPLALDDLAKEKGVTAIVDCGVMPGMGSVLVGQAVSQLDDTEEVLIYVGGLPVVREWPFEYKAAFSPADVIEEYVRPARFIENGQVATRPALSDPELVEFPEVGTLEAFNTDGLRTMMTTIRAHTMREKTLRYPGHIEKMALLRECGFFSSEQVEVDGARVAPLAVTSRLMFPLWKLKEGEADLTVMRIQVHGTSNGKTRTFRFDLLDRFDKVKGVTSMARTTGYTATVAVRMLREGLYGRKGVSPPEFIGKHPECVAFLVDQLAHRGVRYNSTVD